MCAEVKQNRAAALCLTLATRSCQFLPSHAVRIGEVKNAVNAARAKKNDGAMKATLFPPVARIHSIVNHRLQP